MTSINFILRPSSKADGQPGSLMLRIIHSRRVRNLTLSGSRLYAHEWDSKTQSIVYPENDPERSSFLQTVEQRIDNKRALVGDYLVELKRRGAYSVNDLVCLIRKRSSHDKLVGYTEMLSMELERNGCERTARAYRTVVRGFVSFNNGEDIHLFKIHSALIKSFEAYLKNQGKKPNTISYYMRNLRAIHNKASASGHLSRAMGDRPFAGVYTGNDKTRKRALSAEDLKSLYSLHIPDLLNRPGLYFAWRLFFFCFYARGMCFVDLAHLQKSNIRKGVIKYCRKKTGQQVEIKVIHEMQHIIDSFAEETQYSDYVFPIIKDKQKKEGLQYENGLSLQNRRLKALSRLAGIGPVSTHVARHTWATIGKRENIPLRVLSECLGHSSENTTLIYLDLLDSTVLDEANDRITSIVTN